MLRAARILPDAAALAVLVTLAAAVAGCGSEFKLPTEKRVNVIPAEKAYRTEALWPGMLRVRDVLLTQRYGQQLFILFERPD